MKLTSIQITERRNKDTKLEITIDYEGTNQCFTAWKVDVMLKIEFKKAELY
jgi:hypothetical protein